MYGSDQGSNLWRGHECIQQAVIWDQSIPMYFLMITSTDNS